VIGNSPLMEAVVAVRPDMSGFEDEAVKGVSSTMDKIAGGADRLGRKATTRLTLPILGLGAAAVKSASDAEEMQGKFNTVFGDLSDEVAAWAQESGSAMNRSRFDLMGYLATLQDTFVPMGFARDEAADMSKQITELGVDLASFNNIPTDQVVQNLTSALIGNHQAVAKFGVIINQAALDQELLNMGIEGGASAASEAEKMQARLNIILASTTDAQGDAIRTSDSFANQMRGMQAALQELAVVFGNEILPHVTALVQKITPLIAKFTGLDDSTKKIILTIAGVAAVIGPLLIITAKLINSVKAITAVVKLMNLAFLANPLVLFIAAVVAAGFLIWKFRDQIGEFIRNVVAWFSGLGERLSAPFQRLGDTIRTVFQSAVGLVKGFINQILGMWEKVINGPANAANTLIKAANRVPGVNIPTLPTINIPRLAEGGDIRRAGRVMVGEEGPEYLDLPRGARVTPLDKAGETVNVTMNVTVQGGQFDEAQLARELDRIARRAAATSGYRRPA
jgi:hypothetical protein